MKQSIDNLASYIKALKTFRNSSPAQYQLTLLVPLLRALKVMVEQKGIGTGKLHYIQRYNNLLVSIRSRIVVSGKLTPILSTNGNYWDISELKIPVPKEDVPPLSWCYCSIGGLMDEIKNEHEKKLKKEKLDRENFKIILKDFSKSLSPQQKRLLTELKELPLSSFIYLQDLLCQ